LTCPNRYELSVFFDRLAISDISQKISGFFRKNKKVRNEKLYFFYQSKCTTYQWFWTPRFKKWLYENFIYIGAFRLRRKVSSRKYIWKLSYIFEIFKYIFKYIPKIFRPPSAAGEKGFLTQGYIANWYFLSTVTAASQLLFWWSPKRSSKTRELTMVYVVFTSMN